MLLKIILLHLKLSLHTLSLQNFQKSLVEAFTKKLQLVSHPLLLHAKLLDSFWGHAILHATTFLRL